MKRILFILMNFTEHIFEAIYQHKLCEPVIVVINLLVDKSNEYPNDKPPAILSPPMNTTAS